MSEAPPRIWVDWDGDWSCTSPDVVVNDHRVHDDDVEYCRVDLSPAIPPELRGRLRDEINKALEVVNGNESDSTKVSRVRWRLEQARTAMERKDG